MRFKHKSRGSQIVQVNLVPLIDILATVLIFFVVISMTLTSQQSGINIELPTTSKSSGVAQEESPEPLVVGLSKKGEVLVENKAVSQAELAVKIQTYLQEKPEGAIILKADKQIAYEQVIKLLANMKEIGGDRVSLAIDQK
jgi:biopolymer transport protein ExbD